MKTHSFGAALLAATLLPQTGYAQDTAEMVCGERDNVVAQLEGRYGESVRSVGLAPHNQIVEIFASDDTGTWTITVTTTDGTTCLMASGQHFEDLLPTAPGAPL